MKKIFFLIGLSLILVPFTFSQEAGEIKEQEQEIHSLIEAYSQARTEKDLVLLSSMLTIDIDQLVSSGKWRKGKDIAMKGMMQSSESNPGSRSLKIESIRFLNPECAIADARYEIQNADGSERKMWSTFIVVSRENRWKISAIRNMLPAQP
jgi:uncharacterized protein (TIGR02246 family)